MRVLRTVGAVVFGAVALFGATAFLTGDKLNYIIGGVFILIGGGLSYLCAHKSPEEKERIARERSLKEQEARIRTEAKQAEKIARAEADRAAAAARAQRASDLRRERESELRDRFVKENAARAQREEAEKARRDAEAERKKREYDEKIAREVERRRQRAAEKRRREEERRQRDTEEFERNEAEIRRKAAEKEAARARKQASRSAKPSFWEELKAQQAERRQTRDANVARARAQGLACCPYCGSTGISANKRGYKLGKGVLWGFLLGFAGFWLFTFIGFAIGLAVGLSFGSVGSGAVTCTCLSCGRRFRPGQRNP